MKGKDTVSCDHDILCCSGSPTIAKLLGYCSHIHTCTFYKCRIFFMQTDRQIKRFRTKHCLR